MPTIPDEALDAWDLFLASMTQWRVGFGGATGLDYRAVFHVSTSLEIEITEETLKYLNHMEHAYLELQKDISDKEDS